MVRVGIVGLGKMGLSHLSMFRAHPDVRVDGVVDATGYVLDVLAKYTGVRTFKDLDSMLNAVELDAVVIATPTRFHFEMVRSAIARGLHVFCEKPLSLTGGQSEELADLAQTAGVVTQVGYHNRYVGAFGEVKSLLDAGAIGKVTHVLAEAYGPVVLKPKGGTWRSRKSEGGGCLYDYAAHPIDLLSWYLGAPAGVGGTVLGNVFSAETEDEVFSTLFYPGGASGQVSVNWSDESCRKMTTKITLWGTAGRIYVDRQECQVYLRDTADLPAGYRQGWNVRYTTDLTDQVWFYLRGEEYSAQVDDFVRRIQAGETAGRNTFVTAAVTDRVLDLMTRDANNGPSTSDIEPAALDPADASDSASPSRLGQLREVIESGATRARHLLRNQRMAVAGRWTKGRG